MKQFLINYRGFDIYVWTTGKFEAYLGDKPMGLAGTDLKTVRRKIDERQEELNNGEDALPDTDNQPRFNIFERNGQ